MNDREEFVEELEDYVKENYEVYDRFTFDYLIRNLLKDGYDHEEAKDIIIHNCALSTLVMQERIYNEYIYKISIDEEQSKDLIDFRNEIVEKIMTLRGKEYNRFYDYLINSSNSSNSFRSN